MATPDKDYIFVGDTYKVTYESLQSDQLDTNGYGFIKSEAAPDSAYAQVYSTSAGGFLELGGEGTDRDDADVEGNVVSYTLSGNFTAESGAYKIFITALYPDGQKVTAMRQFQVKTRQ